MKTYATFVKDDVESFTDSKLTSCTWEVEKEGSRVQGQPAIYVGEGME